VRVGLYKWDLTVTSVFFFLDNFLDISKCQRVPCPLRLGRMSYRGKMIIISRGEFAAAVRSSARRRDPWHPSLCLPICRVLCAASSSGENMCCRTVCVNCAKPENDCQDRFVGTRRSLHAEERIFIFYFYALARGRIYCYMNALATSFFIVSFVLLW
jgi:hypothetical protein